MTDSPGNASDGSLPRLSGRLLSLYRLAWCVLAIGAVAVSALTALQIEAAPAVLGLRLAKGVVLIGVAAILLYRRQRDPVAALLALAFLTWTITSSFGFSTKVEFAQLLDRCRFFLFALALLLFPDGRWQARWGRAVAAVSAGAFLVGIGETLGLVPTRAFLPLAIPCVVAGIGSLVARFRTSTDYALRQQLKWVALGLIAGVGLILGARAGSAAPSLVPATPVLWEAMFQLGIMIVALGFLVSLLRYRLFDAETVISRSAAYAALTIALVATFGGTEAAIENLGQRYLGMNIGSISGAMAAAVAAVLLQPLHARISEWAEDRFQPDLAQLKRRMPELLSALSEASAPQLADAALPHINDGIHATRSALMIDGQVVASFGTDVPEACDALFPLRLPVGNASPGERSWLLLGPRPDGTLYGREDLDAVRSVLPALGQALTAARARDRFDEEMEQREQHLRMEIDQIRARLSLLERERRLSA